MITTFIYALCEPGTRTVRYIGKANKVRKRLVAHLTTSVKKDSHLGAWLRKLSFQKTRPELVILKEVAMDSWKEEETRYILCARVLGMDLVNANDGGTGSTNPTTETRAKMSAANKGRIFSDEHRKNLSLSHIGHRPSPEVRAARSAIRGSKHPLFGRRLTEEHKEKLKLAIRGRRPPMLGRHHSSETREKISASLKGNENAKNIS